MDGWMQEGTERTLKKLLLEKHGPSSLRVPRLLNMDFLKEEAKHLFIFRIQQCILLFTRFPLLNLNLFCRTPAAPRCGPLCTAPPACVSGQEFGCRTSSGGTWRTTAVTHTELDIDYMDEELRIKFYILVKPADVCVYVRDRLKEKKEKVRQEGQTENGHEMRVGGIVLQ